MGQDQGSGAGVRGQRGQRAIVIRSRYNTFHEKENKKPRGKSEKKPQQDRHWLKRLID